jgi:hypothetical protein
MEVPPNLNATAQPIESNENKKSCRATTIPGSSLPFCCSVQSLLAVASSERKFFGARASRVLVNASGVHELFL